MGFTGENEKEEEIQGEDDDADIYELFSHYNSLYFDDALGSCLLTWSSHRQMNSCTGDCRYDPRGGCEILLSEPLLKLSSTLHIKNVLLHEMIHAFLWIKRKNRNHSDHGSSFREVRNSINSISVIDAQRPHCGYNITLHHEFRKEVTEPELKKEIKTYRFYHWTCDTCGDLIKKSREPSAQDCIDKVGSDKSCGNLSCHWHNHKNACPGSYAIAESPKYKEKQTSLKVEQDSKHGTFKELPNTDRQFKELPNTDRQSTERESETEAVNRKKEVKMVSKGEQELQTMPYLTRQSTRKLCLAGKSNEKSYGKKATRVADYFQPAEDARRNLVNFESSNDDSCAEVLRQWPDPSIANGHSSAKRASKSTAMWKHRYTSKKRGHGKWENQDRFLGGWLCMYGDEDEDEAVEPLINKRTERRKRLKLLQTAGKYATETEDA